MPQTPEKRERLRQEILVEQVKHVYSVAPFGILATIINALIVFFIMDNVLPRGPLVAWVAAIMAFSAVRAVLVARFRSVSRNSFEAAIWKQLFIAGLAVSGMIWGSLGFFPLAGASLAHEVFLVFVLGGMAAAASSTFSMLKEGYPAYSLPALVPIFFRFILVHDSFHHAMGVMIALYGFLLWRISRYHYQANRASLLLRFENREMVDSLQKAKKKLEGMYRAMVLEIDARIKAEADLAAHQEHLERLVQERTTDLLHANELLKTEIEGRKQVEHALRESRERLTLAQKAGRVGVFDLDLVTGKAVWTEQLEELFGLAPGGFEGDIRGWVKRLHPDDRPVVEDKFREWMRTGSKNVEFEYRAIHADGKSRWMSAAAQLSYRNDGTPIRMIGTTVDSTERKKLEDEIMHMVHHDTLTGLANRRLFMDIISIEIAQARRNNSKLALLFLDLDRFKETNDTFGHNIGDELLKQVSSRVRSSIRESDAAARIGGDEFNILLADIACIEDAARPVRKIMHSLEKTFVVGGYELQITASIGISIYPDDSEDPGALFRFADIAMYHAKAKGRNVMQFYNPDINMRSIERIRFENYLRQAIMRAELIVHYQPQFVVSTGRLVAAEALVRWRHPERGLLEANQFIPSAETTGFITAIDTWVLRTACAQFKAWIDEGHASLCVAVNFSSRIFQLDNVVDIVTAILEETGLPPHSLEIEITESVAMENVERTARVLDKLTTSGIGIAIDDFGTGYSSLNYLKKLPIQRLKIDRSFMKDIPGDADDRAIIKAVTAMAHSMQISVVAEGVERRDQMNFLTETGCDEAQGYLLNKPMPAEDFQELIAQEA